MEHKKELRESINKFIRVMHEEHGADIIRTKDILISEVLDSAREIGMVSQNRSMVVLLPQ